MAFKMKPVPKAALAQLIAEMPQRGRRSQGGELLEEFLSSGETAVTVTGSSTKDRNSLAISVSNFARRIGAQVWVRKMGGGSGTDLLLVNLAKADAATKKAYENRPRPGRKPAS